MSKDYELPKGRRITADFDENGIIKVTVQALDSLIGELNHYADKVCDIEQIRDEIKALPRELPTDARNMVRRTRVLDIIDRHTKGADK